MSDLTDFLLARFAEDEVEGRWLLQYDKPVPGSSHAVVFVTKGSRVLAEVEAKRAIVALGDPWTDYHENPFPDSWYDAMYLSAVRALALPYADHPDYREEWKP